MPATVYIVDDDEGSLKSLAWLVSSVGLQVETFLRPEEFLEKKELCAPACLILDVRMPAISGLEMQTTLLNNEYCPPIIFVTGHGEIPMSVRAMKAGAIDFIQKPIDDQLLLDRIHEAIETDARNRARRQKQKTRAARANQLTARERDVMEQLVAGRTIKEIASHFGISIQTTSKHRARVLEKMHVENDVQLVRLALESTAES